MSTPRTVSAGPFGRHAQVSHVVGRLLLHLRDQNLDLEESDQLARTLLAFLKLLPEETPLPWPRYCGAMGMCFGSLIVLEESRSHHRKVTGETLSLEFFDKTLACMNRVCGRFVDRIDEVPVKAMSPFPPHSVYLAAKTEENLWRETGKVEHLDAANTMVIMLRYFSRRWLSARTSI